MGAMWNWSQTHFALYQAILCQRPTQHLSTATGTKRYVCRYVCPACGWLVRTGPVDVEEHVSGHVQAECDKWWMLQVFS